MGRGHNPSVRAEVLCYFSRGVCVTVIKKPLTAKRFKARHPNRPMRVLDIGSGSGLLAMMAARAGAEVVHSLEMVPALAGWSRVTLDNARSHSPCHSSSWNEAAAYSVRVNLFWMMLHTSHTCHRCVRRCRVDT